jgi:death on curing protein
MNKLHYEPGSSLFDLAAPYSYGLAMNHPFVDGNKRTALLAGLVFLTLNGVAFNALEAEAVVTFQALAAGNVPEGELSSWFATHSEPG